MDTWIDKIQERKAKKDAGWWFKTVTYVLVTVAVLVLGVKLWLKNREIDVLKTKKKLTINSQKREEAKSRIKKAKRERDKALIKAEEKAEKNFSLDRKLEDVQAETENNKNTLSKIKSWEDVDKYVK